MSELSGSFAPVASTSMLTFGVGPVPVAARHVIVCGVPMGFPSCSGSQSRGALCHVFSTTSVSSLSGRAPGCWNSSRPSVASASDAESLPESIQIRYSVVPTSPVLPVPPGPCVNVQVPSEFVTQDMKSGDVGLLPPSGSFAPVASAWTRTPETEAELAEGDPVAWLTRHRIVWLLRTGFVSASGSQLSVWPGVGAGLDAEGLDAEALEDEGLEADPLADDGSEALTGEVGLCADHVTVLVAWGSRGSVVAPVESVSLTSSSSSSAHASTSVVPRVEERNANRNAPSRSVPSSSSDSMCFSSSPARWCRACCLLSPVLLSQFHAGSTPLWPPPPGGTNSLVRSVTANCTESPGPVACTSTFARHTARLSWSRTVAVISRQVFLEPELFPVSTTLLGSASYGLSTRWASPDSVRALPGVGVGVLHSRGVGVGIRHDRAGVLPGEFFSATAATAVTAERDCVSGTVHPMRLVLSL